MKRTLSLMLALVMAVSLMACGKKDDGKNNADAPADSLALLTKVWDSYTDDEKFPAAGGDYEPALTMPPARSTPPTRTTLTSCSPCRLRTPLSSTTPPPSCT